MTICRSFAIILAALASACRADSPGCVDSAQMLADLGEASPAGVSGAEVLAAAEGSHVSTLHYYQRVSDEAFVDVAPPELATSLTIDVVYSTGAVRYVRSTPEETRGPATDVAVRCPDRLEVDVSIAVQTEDGMLAETFDATLARSFDEGGDRPLVGAVIEVDMDVLRGSMVVHDIAPPDPDEIEFTLSLWFYEDGVVGSLGGIVTYERGNSVMAGPFSIATWPRAFGSSE